MRHDGAWAFEHDVAARALTAADRVRSIESLAALRRFAVTYPQVRIVFGHELEAPRQDSVTRVAPHAVGRG